MVGPFSVDGPCQLSLLERNGSAMIVIHVIGWFLIGYLVLAATLGRPEDPWGSFLYKCWWHFCNLDLSFWALLCVAIFFVCL